MDNTNWWKAGTITLSTISTIVENEVIVDSPDPQWVERVAKANGKKRCSWCGRIIKPEIDYCPGCGGPNDY